MNNPANGMIEEVIARSRDEKAEQTIGKLLLDSGKIIPQDAERVLKLQKEKGLRFGEAAVELGLVTEADIRMALARQFDYPYLTPGEGGFSPELVAAYYPFTEQVEALRALRAQLMLRWFGMGRKTLALSGANPGEGVSWHAANLAVVFSQLGERTLLIDADMRNPRQQAIFSLGNRPGLSDMLAARANASAIVRIPQFVDLSVLTSGTIPPNPAELLARNSLAQLLEDFSEHYDVILIDTPPGRIYGDIATIAARAEGAVMIARQDYTRIAEVAVVKESLAGVGAQIVGAVLNRY
jgi:chain length determinant protein tyrosine kinase EpsG